MTGSDALVRFPKAIDVFLPLLDGVHPIVAGDMNDVAQVLDDMQEALGYGTSPTYAGLGVGPKGSNADVADRLDSFLDAEGGLADVAFVVVETTAGQFNEAVSGMFVPFGKQLSSTDYRLVLQVFSEASDNSSGGRSIPSLKTPAWLWISGKARGGFRVAARTTDGFVLEQSTAEKVTLCAIAFGPGSTA